MSGSKLFRVSAVACVSLLASASAGATEMDISRLQRERAQQQMELQLRMQQQQERASRAVPSGPADAQLRASEIDQQRRLRQFQDEQSRAALAADAARGPRNNADQLQAEQTRRFETGRRLNTDRSIAGGR
jgi:hypothetical protein